MSNTVTRLPSQPSLQTAIDLPALITTAVEQRLDPATLQSLLTMYNEQQDRQNKEALNAQMAAAAGEIESVMRDADNKHLSYRYATIAAYMDILRPILRPKHIRVGFEAGALPGEPPIPESHVRVRIVLGHGGYVERNSYVDWVISRQGSQGGRTQMTEQQAIGSALTYAQRYLLKLTFNLTTHDDDDDSETTRTTTTTATSDARTQGTKSAAEIKPDITRAVVRYPSLQAQLLTVPSLERLEAFKANAKFIAFWDAQDKAGDRMVNDLLAARRIDLAAAANTAPTDYVPDETAPASKAGPQPPAGAPADPAQPLLDRIAACQTLVALDSCMQAPEFTTELAKLFPPDGDRVTAAFKARAQALGRQP